MFKLSKKKEGLPQKIPYNIFQMFLCDRSFNSLEDLPTYKYSSLDNICCMRNAVSSFINLNPEYNYYFYDQDGALDYISSLEDNGQFNFSISEYKKCYNKINSNTLKSDFFRLLLIYIEGGIYIDADAYCRFSFSSFVGKDDILVSGTGKRGEIHFGCLAYAPKNQLIGLTIQEGIKNILSFNDDISLENICGAPILNKVFKTIFPTESLELSNLQFVGWKILKDRGSVKIAKRINFSGGNFSIVEGDHLGGALKFQYPRYKNDLISLGASYWKQDKKIIE